DAPRLSRPLCHLPQPPANRPAPQGRRDQFASSRHRRGLLSIPGTPSRQRRFFSLYIHSAVTMKIPQKNAGPFTRVIALPRPNGSEWAFTIRPLPLGFHRRLREQGLIVPTPPVKVARDSAGRPLRDESNLAVTSSDLHDAD